MKINPYENEKYDKYVLSYLAGAIDSDGSIGIKRSTYHIRRFNGTSPSFSSRISLKQVTEDVPKLLKETFGGSYKLVAAQRENGRPLFAYGSANKISFNTCKLLLWSIK